MVQPKNPANGISIAISEVDISIARQSPPAVETKRDRDSLRRNQNRPSPARSGLKTINARMAAPGESVENNTMGGT